MTCRMRRTGILIAAIAALCACLFLGAARGLAIGGVRLSGDMEISDEKVELTNGAEMELSGATWKCEICGKTVKEALITAKKITADLKKSADKKLIVAGAVAGPEVVIHARQVDKAKKSVRLIHATADKAEYTPPASPTADETIVLTGSAAVRITDPDLTEPATLTGSSITIYLNRNKISAKGGDMRIKPREGEQP